MSHATTTIEQRRSWLSVLAKARPEELEAACHTLDPLPQYTWLRPPETGLVMVRARAGGTGTKFNLGEMTVTRCALRLSMGAVGHAYVSGANRRHAELAALADALLQLEEWRDKLRERVVEPLAGAQRERRAAEVREAAATRVEFYTLVRGEDAR